MISLSVKSDAKRLAARLTAIERKLIPFAVAVALTRKALAIKLARKTRQAAEVFVKDVSVW